MSYLVNGMRRVSVRAGFNVNYQSVRYGRKPRWLPMARSKMFRIPPRPQVPEDEAAEMHRVNNQYRTQMKSLMKYLGANYMTVSEEVDHEVHLKEFEEDFSKCNALNDEWNERVKIERDEYFKTQIELEVQQAREILESKILLEEERMEELEQVVREQKQLANTFITPENVDEVIEYALNNPTDYNFSIDLEGNVYQGRETPPSKVTK